MTLQSNHRRDLPITATTPTTPTNGLPAVNSHLHNTPTVDNAPPTRSKVAGILAGVACAACCAIPLLIAAGVLTGAGAAIMEKTLYAVAAGFVVLALSTWWLHRRNSARKAAAAGTGGCGGGNCSC